MIIIQFYPINTIEFNLPKNDIFSKTKFLSELDKYKEYNIVYTDASQNDGNVGIGICNLQKKSTFPQHYQT